MELDRYLFVHFTGESEDGEQIYFSLSEDGLHWKDLNGGKPVIVSETGEKGVRDPFILRSRIDGKFYIISTDLRIANGLGWGVAQYGGSRNIMVCSSQNLTDWTAVKPILLAPEKTGCLWAPEAIYDEKREAYLVFFACMTPQKGTDSKQIIYCSYTKDFENFTAPEVYIEKENHVIDTTIIERDGVYYRFSKDETTKNIIADYGSDVYKGPFTELNCPGISGLDGVEGPAGFKFYGRDEYCVMVDRFAKGLGYLPVITKNLPLGEFSVPDEDRFDMGVTKKRHGSVINISGAEYARLVERFGF